jgi:hypothetical protein
MGRGLPARIIEHFCCQASRARHWRNLRDFDLGDARTWLVRLSSDLYDHRMHCSTSQQITTNLLTKSASRLKKAKIPKNKRALL